MLISILAAAAAFAAPSAAPPAKKPLETRAFGDRKGLLLIVHGNSALWSDGTRFRPLPTRRFSHTLEALELAFEDPRITGGDASFKDGELTCGAEKRKLPELPQTDARYLYSDAHIKAAGEGPTKPALLGMIGDTQEYVYVEGTEPADPNVRRTPRFQMYTGPAGKLVTKPTYASPGTREILVYSSDARVSITPGNMGTGVLITYKRQKYPLGYLTLTQANLETVLGKKLYMDHLGNATHTPCDGLLSD